MANTLPPLPRQDIQNLSPSFQEWLRQLQNSIQGGSGTIPWSSVSKAGANLTDIPTRQHNALQLIEGGGGGNFFHQNSQNYYNYLLDGLLFYDASTGGPPLTLTNTSPGYVLVRCGVVSPTITLPEIEFAGSAGPGAGRRFHIKKEDSGVGIITLVRSSADTFEGGGTSYTLTTQYKSVTLYGFYDSTFPTSGRWLIESST